MQLKLDALVFQEKDMLALDMLYKTEKPLRLDL
jgi:hypothetical protein